MFASPKAPTVGAALLHLFLLIRLYPESPLSWEPALLVRPRCLADHLFSSPGVRCGHNVTHQNSPFSSLRAASLSVAGLNMNDTIFSMSSNVIIFIVNLFPSPSGSHTKTLQMWLNMAHSDAPRRWSFFVLHPSSFLPHPFKCGAKKKGAP